MTNFKHALIAKNETRTVNIETGGEFFTPSPMFCINFQPLPTKAVDTHIIIFHDKYKYCIKNILTNIKDTKYTVVMVAKRI